MTRGEYNQRETDYWGGVAERREANRRFAEPLPEFVPPPAIKLNPPPSVYDHPILGPMMVEEDHRELEGLPPRFSLIY